VHVAYGCCSVFLWQVTKSQGEGAVLGVFFPIDIALYSIAVGTHTKMAEPIEIPFGMMSGLGPRKSARGTVCYVGVIILKGEGAILGENIHVKSNTPMNCELDWSMQHVHTIGADA